LGFKASGESGKGEAGGEGNPIPFLLRIPFQFSIGESPYPAERSPAFLGNPKVNGDALTWL